MTSQLFLKTMKNQEIVHEYEKDIRQATDLFVERIVDKMIKENYFKLSEKEDIKKDKVGTIHMLMDGVEMLDSIAITKTIEKDFGEPIFYDLAYEYILDFLI